jgi:hypothetical protein
MPGAAVVRDVECAPDASEDAAAELVPAPTAAAVRACSHDAWAPLFREHTYSSEAIDLPPARRCARAPRSALLPI